MRYAVAWALTIAIVFGALVVTTQGCGVSTAAIKTAETQQAIFLGISKRTDIKADTRHVAEAAYDAFGALLYNLTGRLMPPETVVRLRERDLLDKDYPQ